MPPILRRYHRRLPACRFLGLTAREWKHLLTVSGGAMECIRSVASELRPGVCHDVTRRALLRLVRSQPSNSSSVFTSLEHFAAIDLGCSNQYLFWETRPCNQAGGDARAEHRTLLHLLLQRCTFVHPVLFGSGITANLGPTFALCRVGPPLPRVSLEADSSA